MAAKTADKGAKVLNSYDLLAVKPSTQAEPVFEQICTRGEMDVISVDCSQRFSFFIQKSWIKLALQRGVIFEITYGSGCLEHPETRRQFLSNSIALCKLTKGKAIVMGSETNDVLL